MSEPEAEKAEAAPPAEAEEPKSTICISQN
jgi:hypothetical protein